MIAIAFLAGALLVASPAAASPAPFQRTESVTLAPGESVSLRLDADGGLAVVDRASNAALGEYDRAALAVLLREDYAAASGPNARAITDREPGLPPAPAVIPGQVRATLLQVGADRQTLLVMENGYDRGLLYRARITSNGRTAPTDVCLVIPRGRGHEHWPYAIEQIELSSLRLEAWDDSQGPRCE